ncbi:hypothetical protein LTR54_007222 [Friedmanniomyces endolithicus]|uniref:Sfi1 spindle body domain-containing protein n=1 Tax=Friedmanniomyces endolithicus TaxID=329885 RepID=A0AAN6FJK5_9PEZI|nr:hypothetical protein LTR82_009313 [Friedmanniomyces endolithicus]KAK1004901.1 hypothetical protein LTR54_007222 [Friedmanniomyces endolithicus]
MSDNAPYQDELPDLSDEDISLLHHITTLAQQTSPPAPPFRALFAAYDAVFAQQGVEQEHDGVVFRVLLRVGEAAREGGGRAGERGVDLVGCLKGILQAQGITVVEDEGERASEVARAGGGGGAVVEGLGAGGSSGGRKKKNAVKRRVSFDDARLDETWLSEHSRSLVAPAPRQLGQRSLLAQPARRGRLPGNISARRARSISSQRPATTFTRQSAPKHFQQASPSTLSDSDYDTHANPTLLFQPSQTQLEQNAEAFASTSAVRAARHCIHIWHDKALILHQTQRQARTIATAHDQRTLLKQAFDQWRTNLSARKDAHAKALLQDQLDELASHHYRRGLISKAFSHWVLSLAYQQKQVRDAQVQILRIRYFYRWRNLAVDNAVKARSILTRKYLGVWRAKLARRQLREEQALAKCEESRVRACWRAWFWHFCSRRVEGWRENSIKRRAVETWRAQLSILDTRRERAQHLCDTNVARRALHVLRDRFTQQQQALQSAETHCNRTLATRHLRTLTIRTRLEPLGRTLTLKVTLDLQRKAFRIWHLHLQLSRQATEVDRQRILQSAWTNWNDALRCRALGQRIDERVVVECLYKWVLAERGRLMRKRVEEGLARRALGTWAIRRQESSRRYQQAEQVFAERQQRRYVSSAMVKLHLAVRKREDAERAAVEFASARALPSALDALTTKFWEVQQLGKWAEDARFYTLCTRALAVWKERTTQHQYCRKRDAYARVRARIKIRVVGTCLMRWKTKTAQIRQASEAAEQMARRRVVEIGSQAFDQWRDKNAQIRQMAEQAEMMDRQKLIVPTFSALTTRFADLALFNDRAETFKRESDLAVLAAALKRLQWAQFTAARRAESAEALWARNRDAHVRNIVRLWAAQTTSLRQARHAVATTGSGEQDDEEPESPSLRPASRAASRSRAPAREQGFPSSPPMVGAVATPAYLRTPSRSRRAGRFRPLGTPAAGTPFAFEVGYLATTPAPLPALSILGGEGSGEGVLTPQVTPFARKLRAGGFGNAQVRHPDARLGTGAGYGVHGGTETPAPALKNSVFGRSVLGTATAKSVRFAGASRFGSAGTGGNGHMKSS